MDWNRIEGNWKQVKGKVKVQWGKLTDDELDKMNGRRDQLEGKIQERYGIAKDQAKKDVDTHDRWWSSRIVIDRERRRPLPRCHLAADIRCLHPGLLLRQHTDDLLFRES